MFTKAITRKPCRALIDGISTAMFGEGKPVYEDAIAQHAVYVETLRELGLDVTVLEGDERFPDSCFVEDPAVVMAECAIVTNPATDSRRDEKIEMAEVLKKFYDEDRIFHIEAPGTMEGGDVMLVDKHFYVGLSDRTNEEAVRQFAEIVGQYGYETTAVPVTEGLHLKDFVIYLDKGQMLVSAVMNEQPAFAEYERFVIDEDELYAINSMNINGTVLVPKGFPKTAKLIEDLGYPIKLMDTNEFRLIDGSLTCLSLRF
jgi:dimethylargininase